MKVRINTFPKIRADLWLTRELDERDEYIGSFESEDQFNDVRVQIKQNQLEGYYVYYNHRKIPIDKNGGISEWPDGFFHDRTTRQLNYLIGIDSHYEADK